LRVTGQRKIRVAVVFGGRSAEHAVSCASAGLVLSAIDRDRYDVLPIGIATDGRWVLTSGDPARLALSSGSSPSVEAVAVPGSEITPRADGALVVSSPGSVPRDLGEVDVVLPLLHGTYGEDGTIQGLLEMTGTRYAGAGVFASAAGMDKEYMKLIIAARGLPVGRYVVVRDRDWSGGTGASVAGSAVAGGAVAGGPVAGSAVAGSLDERKRVLDEIAELGWPVFVKPARGGSSVGITRVLQADDLESAVEAARVHDPKVLVEAAVDGMEVECAVLEGIDGGPPEASVPGQVVVDPGSSFYDFQAKYLAAGTMMRIPAPIPADAAAEVRRLACAAFEAISCEGLARVDFFYTPAGQVVFNEINTMPGMTPASGFPMMWAATGLPLPQLIDRIIQTALRKRPGPRLQVPVVAGPGGCGPGRLRARAVAGPGGCGSGRLRVRAVAGPGGCGSGGCGSGGCGSGRLRVRAVTGSAETAAGRRLLLGGLLAVDEGLEVGARAELRHRTLGHLDGGSGAGVAGGTSRTLALLEDAEPGDGDLVAVRDGRLHGLENRVHGFGRGFLVAQPARDRIDQITLVHDSLLRFPHRPRGLRSSDARYANPQDL
jgi:D-alanine-D-alanine ligase